MVYILKGKVSWLLLVVIIWTASSDEARQACGKAAAHWGNAQAVTLRLAGNSDGRAASRSAFNR
jgi:cell division inhibitor SulA